MTDSSSRDPNPINPFRDEPAAVSVRASQPIAIRPAGVTAVGVVSIVAGVLAAMAGIWILLNTLFAKQLQQAYEIQSAPFQAAQEEMQTRMRELADKYRPVNTTIGIINSGLGIALIVGGAGLLRGRESSRKLLMRVFVVAIGFEVLRIIPFSMSQLETMPVMQEYMERMSVSSSSGGSHSPAATAGVAKVMILLGYVMWALWGVVKIALYGTGTWYLTRPRVVGYSCSASGEPA
jgi:hypothetical protein